MKLMSAIFVLFILIISKVGTAMVHEKFLDHYSGQSVDELISMEKEYRIDSLVLTFESALNQKAAKFGVSKLSETEQIILSVEALEREVNNGGYHQFFINSSKDYASIIVKALNKIGCHKTAEITQGAINALDITGAITSEAIDNVIRKDMASDNKLRDVLGKFDDLYYRSGEPIADPLFKYIKEHKTDIKF